MNTLKSVVSSKIYAAAIIILAIIAGILFFNQVILGGENLHLFWSWKTLMRTIESAIHGSYVYIPPDEA